MGGRGKRTSPSKRGRGGKKGNFTQTRVDELLKPRRSARQASLLNLKSQPGNVEVPTEKQVIIILDQTNRADKKIVPAEKKVSSGGGGAKLKRLSPKELKEKTAAELKERERIEEEELGLLKDFDLNPVYGPCRGITRRARFLRAMKFGLQPTPSKRIFDVLEMHEDDARFQSCIWDQCQLLKLRF